ncbi:carbohydrate ABC transporter permease [Natrinema salaciae]|uniref:Carbohydrate ABC transporter membrane protein 1, CUT1 family n=1 Tax=Natrinema salaciae TaxID=1186196 RepID=A0A1H9IMG7_9EURY|nr:sugar ABC transporter permease [Natrinema salaciae]SEQ75595.1 carbohydrate ABC transporter membrane protein 1, CUT1 family [Natrinema salaciae]
MIAQLLRSLRQSSDSGADSSDRRRADGGERSDRPRPSSELRADGGEPSRPRRPSSELRSDGGVDAAESGLGRSDETDPGRSGSTLDALRRSEFVRSLPFWLPGFLLVGAFVYGAIGWNFLISLTDWSGLGDPNYSNISFDTYVQLLGDPTFRNATWNTFVLMVAFTVIALAVGLFLAILMDREIRFGNGFRTIYLLPMSLSFVVTAIFWKWMYNANDGVINVVLKTISFGAIAPNWLGDPRFKLWAVIIALIWQFSGYCMIVYLAALRAIPDDHYEAARVDGATTVRLYWRVIIPQLRAATMGATVVLMVFALKAFDFIYVIYGGSQPGPSADILGIMMYREAFAGKPEWAYGSAVAMVLFVLALAVIAPYAFAQYRRGDL